MNLIFFVTCPGSGYAGALDWKMVDRVAVETLGFPIILRAQRTVKVNQTSLVNKLVRQTSWQSRQAFATKIHQAHNPLASLVPRVATAEIVRTLGPDEHLTEADILNMVKNFLSDMRGNAQVVTVLKSLLLHDLTVRLDETSFQGQRGQRGSRCALGNLRSGLYRLARETFLLR